MKLAALFSGGKDSVYAAWIALQQGWEVSHLVSIRPKNPSSYMFHYPNIWVTSMQAESAGIPHMIVQSSGEKERELKDLKKALSLLEIDGVVSGAVESEYQKERIDFVCHELGIKSFAPLWHKPQERLAREQAEALEAIIVAVSAEGLGKEWLGKKYDSKCIGELKKLKESYGVSICGEGGEFETLVLNAPFFSKRIRITSAKAEWRGSSGSLKAEKAVFSATP